MKKEEIEDLATLSDEDLMKGWNDLEDADKARYEQLFGTPAPLVEPLHPDDWTDAMDECAESCEVWDYSPSMGQVYSSDVEIRGMPDLVMRNGFRLPRDVLKGMIAEFESGGLVQLGGGPLAERMRAVFGLIDPRSARRLWEWARNHSSIRFSEGVLNWGGHFLTLDALVSWLDEDLDDEWFEKLLLNYYGPGDSLFLAIYYEVRPRPADLLEFRYEADGFESLDDWVEATIPDPVPPELLPVVYRWLAAAVRRGRRWSPHEWDVMRQRPWFRHAADSLLVSLRTADDEFLVCNDDGDWIDVDYDVVEGGRVVSYGFVDRAELTPNEHDRWARTFYELERIQPYDQLISPTRTHDPGEVLEFIDQEFDIERLPFPWQLVFTPFDGEIDHELDHRGRYQICKTARGEARVTFEHVMPSRARLVRLELRDAAGEKAEPNEIDPLFIDRVVRDLSASKVP